MFDLWKNCSFICNLLKKLLEKIRKNLNEFEKIRKNSTLTIRNSIRFEGKIIRFVRFEKFSIRLIRKYFFNSKNSRKINSKFVRFDSTPPLMRSTIISQCKAQITGNFLNGLECEKWSNNARHFLLKCIPKFCLETCSTLTFLFR